jgi:hypothetical protein
MGWDLSTGIAPHISQKAWFPTENHAPVSFERKYARAAGTIHFSQKNDLPRAALFGFFYRSAKTKQ